MKTLNNFIDYVHILCLSFYAFRLVIFHSEKVEKGSERQRVTGNVLYGQSDRIILVTVCPFVYLHVYFSQ